MSIESISAKLTFRVAYHNWEAKKTTEMQLRWIGKEIVRVASSDQLKNAKLILRNAMCNVVLLYHVTSANLQVLLFILLRSKKQQS